MSYTITIAPLATPGHITQAALAAILNANLLFLQTKDSPCADSLLELRLPYTAMDDLYESAADFDGLNEAIAQRLCAAGQDAVYAVCGRSIGDAALLALTARAEQDGGQVRRLPSPGYAQTALCALPRPLPEAGMVCCPANGLPPALDPYHTLCIEEIDTVLAASDVKLALGEYFPDEYPVWLCALGKAGYHTLQIPVLELDRQKNYAAGTCLIVPPAQPAQLTRKSIDDLMAVMERLRGPGGCPWDAEQTHLSLRGPLIEEAYEVLDAIEREDDEALCEELGDLLLQIAFHTILAKEQAAFTLRDVSTGIVQKLIYRHPHVFGGVHVGSSGEVKYNWEQLKQKEKHQSTAADAMRAVPRAFPALMRSAKVQKKAAHVGFDWTDPRDALQKLPEETQEILEAMEQNDAAHIDEEVGDLLFAAVNVARLLGRDPEAMLHQATDKFMDRFARMEACILQERGSLADMSLADMDAYWNKIKLERLKK
ncbi:MAG: nucleoside triphosphate pyrophosphohydrolase [Candidatus Pelethousia sp.]|nr:nucleoside triphosphate pyrophosphohydrolase [Candidatus Pelethousia sp.]